MIYNKKIKLPVLCYGLFVFSCQNKDRSVSASDTKGSEKEESLIVEYQDPTDKELKKVKNEKKKLEDEIKEYKTKITSLEDEVEKKTKEIKEKENLIKNSTYQNISKSTQFQEEKEKLEKEIKDLKSELTKLKTEKTTLENREQVHLEYFCKLIYELFVINIPDFIPVPVVPPAPLLALDAIVNIKENDAKNLKKFLEFLGVKVNFDGVIKTDTVPGGVGKNKITGFTFPLQLKEISAFFDVKKNSTEIKDAINAKYPGLIT